MRVEHIGVRKQQPCGVRTVSLSCIHCCLFCQSRCCCAVKVQSPRRLCSGQRKKINEGQQRVRAAAMCESSSNSNSCSRCPTVEISKAAALKQLCSSNSSSRSPLSRSSHCCTLCILHTPYTLYIHTQTRFKNGQQRRK